MYTQGYVSQTKGLINTMYLANAKMGISQKRISTGDSFAGRIDNPVDVLKASRAEADMRGNHMAQRNIQDALAFLELKSVGLSEIELMGQRLNELSVQYANDTLTVDDRAVIEKEAASLLAGIEHTLDNTKFNDGFVFSSHDNHFQAGSQSGDMLSIKASVFDTSYRIEERTKIQLASKTYDLRVMAPGTIDNTTNRAALSGELTLDLRPDGKPSGFTIKEGSNTHTGSISFTDEKTGAFSLNYGGQTLKGTLNLSDGAKGSSMTGNHTYTLNWESGGGTAAVSMTETGSHTKEVTETSHRNITLRDASQISVKEALRTGFAQNHILSPIAKQKAQVAIETSTFDRRLSSVMNKGELATSNLSRIRDADIAKEMMALTKQELLATVNANLLTKRMDDQRSRVLSLLA